MAREETPWQRLQALLEGQRYAVLCTLGEEGAPYASLVAFRAADDLGSLFFCTRRGTRKFENLSAHGRVALLIDDRANHESDLQTAAAATVVGVCQEVQESRRHELASWFLQRHSTMAGFVQDPVCAMLEVKVQHHVLVSSFEQVVRLKVPGGGQE